MKKFIDTLTLTWNDAEPRDWNIIKRFFVAAYLTAYKDVELSELGLNDQHIERASLLINRHEKTPEQIVTLIKLTALRLSFTEDFENEKIRILTQDQSSTYKIQYIIARAAFGYPVAFVASQLNYKTGHVYLRWVTVNPRTHGFGLGRKMLDNITKHYDTTHLELYTRRTNFGARGFYEHYGFSEIQLGREDIAASDSTDFHKNKPSTALLLYYLHNKQLFPPHGEETSHHEVYIGYSLK